MRKLQILMPMGGLGKRFSDAGYKLPKPLIPVDGMPMFQKAVSSFADVGLEIELVTVFRREHQTEFQLGDKLQAAYPEIKIVIIDELTRGAVETCYFAREIINPEDGLVVLDCDLWFNSPDYLAVLCESLSTNEPKWAGALTYFEAVAPRYSFLKIEEGVVTDIAEKRPISTHAIVGAYFFSHARTFFNVAQAMLKEPPSGAAEYYVSLIYKTLLGQGEKFTAKPIKDYHSFGTPEELTAYEKRT